jgi:hypothetical protein
MIMVRHENIAMKDKAMFLLRFSKILLEFLVIPLREKYLSSLTATCRHVVDGSFIFYP